MAIVQIFLVLVLGIVNVWAVDTCCPDSWVPYKGSCYYFYDEVKVTWEDAYEHCKHHDSDLVIVETRNENLFLKSYVRKLFREASFERNSTIFWLGATDEDIDGIWKWVATGEELVYTDWDASLNQPTYSADNHEDCLALNGGYDFAWHDGICSKNVGSPICEKKGGAGDGGINSLQYIGR